LRKRHHSTHPVFPLFGRTDRILINLLLLTLWLRSFRSLSLQIPLKRSDLVSHQLVVAQEVDT
jgi:hypothetical protein